MNALALVIGAALIAAAIAAANRYSVVATPCGDDCSRAWEVNRWTGQMRLCEYQRMGGNRLLPACFATIGESVP
jgi:hypothetical protein